MARKTKADLEKEIVELRDKVERYDMRLLERLEDINKLQRGNANIREVNEDLNKRCISVIKKNERLEGKSEGLQHALDTVLMAQHHQDRFAPKDVPAPDPSWDVSKNVPF